MLDTEIKRPDPRVPEMLTYLLKSKNRRIVNRALMGLKRYATQHMSKGNFEVDSQRVADTLMKHLPASLKWENSLREPWHLYLAILGIFAFNRVNA